MQKVKAGGDHDRRTSERKEPCLGLKLRPQFNDPEAMRVRDNTCWGVHISLEHQRLHMQFRQIKSKFVGAIVGIERRARHTSSHCETCHGYLWTMGEDHGNPVMYRNIWIVPGYGDANSPYAASQSAGYSPCYPPRFLHRR